MSHLLDVFETFLCGKPNPAEIYRLVELLQYCRTSVGSGSINQGQAAIRGIIERKCGEGGGRDSGSTQAFHSTLYLRRQRDDDEQSGRSVGLNQASKLQRVNPPVASGEGMADPNRTPEPNCTSVGRAADGQGHRKKHVGST
jgi:hypothetical protein